MKWTFRHILESKINIIDVKTSNMRGERFLICENLRILVNDMVILSNSRMRSGLCTRIHIHKLRHRIYLTVLVSWRHRHAVITA